MVCFSSTHLDSNGCPGDPKNPLCVQSILFYMTDELVRRVVFCLCKFQIGLGDNSEYRESKLHG